MDKRELITRRLARLASALVLAGASHATLLGLQAGEVKWVSCDELMAPKKTIQGKQIGQESCLMREEAFSYRGRKYRRVDLRVSGTSDGYSQADKQVPAEEMGGMSGTQAEYFNSDPEFVFEQFAQTKWFHGTGRYEGSGGVGVDVFYPEQGTSWNGKFYFGVTGTGLCVWEGIQPDKPRTDVLSDVSGLYRLMLDKGYAVAIVTKNASSVPPGNLPCVTVTLDSGAKLARMNLTDHSDIHLDFLKLSENLLKARLGKDPSRTYWYGKSSGSRLGRLINYKPGLNVGNDGKPLIDGFFQDDAATGLWLPVLYKDGKDVLFASQVDKDHFTKQIDITHQAYVNTRGHTFPPWVSTVYTMNKRTNTKILRDKGLGKKHRMYEIRGVSHSGGEFLGDPDEIRRRGESEALNLVWVFDGVIDLLDQWVENGVEPPPTQTDALELSDTNGDGVIEHPAVALPEVACPLGIFYPYPGGSGAGGVGNTGFAPFDGKSLEPKDGRGVWVDMNRNQYIDQRESLTQAWLRLGLLKPGQKFSRDRYMDCMKTSVDGLVKARLITERGGSAYIEQVLRTELPSQPE